MNLDTETAKALVAAAGAVTAQVKETVTDRATILALAAAMETALALALPPVKASKKVLETARVPVGVTAMSLAEDLAKAHVPAMIMTASLLTNSETRYLSGEALPIPGRQCVAHPAQHQDWMAVDHLKLEKTAKRIRKQKEATKTKQA
jgi:hypothetical protein